MYQVFLLVVSNPNIIYGYENIPHFPFLQAWSPVQAVPVPHMHVVPEQLFPLPQGGSHVGDSKTMI